MKFYNNQRTRCSTTTTPLTSRGISKKAIPLTGPHKKHASGSRARPNFFICSKISPALRLLRILIRGPPFQESLKEFLGVTKNLHSGEEGTGYENAKRNRDHRTTCKRSGSAKNS